MPDNDIQWENGCRIHARYADVLGRPAKGVITFRPTASGALLSVQDSTIVLPPARRVKLEDGVLDIVLPATDDDRYNPTNFSYEVVEHVPGGRKFYIDAPMNGTVDLALDSPVAESVGNVTVRGPKGDKGDKGDTGLTGAASTVPGPQGIKGDKGDTGLQGSAGKSAYTIAVEGGFVGTQAQWIASLKGAQGANGSQGIQGIQGVKGDPGAPGAPGAPGTKGDKGDKGDPGSSTYILDGLADPNGAVTAGPGVLYLRHDGSVWRKASGAGNTGWVSDTEAIVQLQNDLLAAQDAIAAIPTGGVMKDNWSFTTADGSLQTGFVGARSFIPVRSRLDIGPIIDSDDYHLTADTSLLIEVNPGPDRPGYVSMYDSSIPTIVHGAGNTGVFGNAPSRPDIPAGSFIRPKLVSVAPAGTTSAVAASRKATGTVYNTGAGTGNTNIIPIPAGGATGDIIVVFAVNAGPAMSMPAGQGWVKLVDRASDVASAKVRTAIFAAPWAAGTTATITSTGTPTMGLAIIVDGADASNLNYQTADETTGNGDSSTAAGSHTLVTAAASDDLVDRAYIVAGTCYNGTSADNYTHDWSGGPSGTAQIANTVTTRGSTTSDLGMSVYALGAVAKGTAPAPIVAVTGGAGAGGSGGPGAGLKNVGWASGLVFVKRKPGTNGPRTLNVQVITQAV